MECIALEALWRQDILCLCLDIPGTQPWLTNFIISVNAAANLANQGVLMGYVDRYYCERERKREPS
jgi:hypothetical protein